ncbi:hypothetical protein V8E53_004782 [Lactarius tabidus]
MKKILLPLLPLKIKIGANQPRGTKCSAASAALVDKPQVDQSEDREPGPGNMVTSVKHRVRFQSPLESRPKQRLPVGDTAEAAPDKMWVAVGEVGPFDNVIFAQTLTLLAGQVQSLQARGEGGKSWLCNPPDSWFEGGKVSFPSTLCLFRIADQALVASYPDSLLEMKQDLQDVKVMATALYNRIFTPLLLPGLSTSASTLPLPVSGLPSHMHVPQHAVSNNHATRMNKEPFTPTPEFLNRSWTADVGQRRRCFHNSWASRRWLVSEEDLRTWLKVYVTLYSNHDRIFYSSDFSSAIAIFH